MFEVMTMRSFRSFPLFGAKTDDDQQHQQRVPEDFSILNSALATYGSIGTVDVDDDESRLWPALTMAIGVESVPINEQEQKPPRGHTKADDERVSLRQLPTYQTNVESSQPFGVSKKPLLDGDVETETTSLMSDEDYFMSSERSTERPGGVEYPAPSLCGRGFSIPGWAAYNNSLDTDPVKTKAMTSLCGWFLGDFVTQEVIEGGPFDVHRSVVLASFGFFFHGPVGHFLYNGLDHLLVGKGPKEVVLKIIIDQVLWCPIFMIAYFTYLGLANGDSLPIISSKIQTDLFTAVQGSWKVWPLAHAINFKFVATKHRIIYINCIEVCFIMFLSLIGNAK